METETDEWKRLDRIQDDKQSGMWGKLTINEKRDVERLRLAFSKMSPKLKIYAAGCNIVVCKQGVLTDYVNEAVGKVHGTDEDAKDTGLLHDDDIYFADDLDDETMAEIQRICEKDSS